jgi:hypothetical protein
MSCCKDCADRRIGCHSRCERYKAFRKERELILESKRVENIKDTVEMIRQYGRRQSMIMRKKAGLK